MARLLLASILLGLVFGCDGTSLPPSPTGGARLTITAGTPEGERHCSRVNAQAQHAIPPGNSMSSTDSGARVVHGDEGARVACRVARAGAGFEVHAELEQAGVSLTIDGVLTASAGTADVTTHAPSTLFLSNIGEAPPAPCTLTVNGGQVGDGYIFADWRCPKLGDPDEPSVLCEGDGTIAFENCTVD